MLALESEKRPTVQQVLDHPWTKGLVPTQEEVM